MALPIQGQVGEQVLSDGTTAINRLGKGGDGIVSELHGRYYEQTYRNRMFFAATQAGQTTSVGLTTAYVGIVVSNPIGSTVNLAINKIGWSWTVIAAAVNNIAIGVGYHPSTQVTHTTPLSVFNNKFLNNANVGTQAKADSTATLPAAPVYYQFLQDTATATTNPTGGLVDLEGSLIIPPGGYVCTLTSAASSAAAFWASMQWEEFAI